VLAGALVTLPARAAAPKATQYADLVPGTPASNRQILAIGNSNTYGGTYATVREALSRADMDVSFADMSPVVRFS
jgi:hypothetical protein